MGQPELVSKAAKITSGTTPGNSSQENSTNFTRNSTVAPFERETESPSLSLMRRAYTNRGFSEKATNIVLQSWRHSSRKQYDTHIKKWLIFCGERQIDPVQPTIGAAVEFLTMLYEYGLSYSSINTARCALSAILDISGSNSVSFGEHPDVKRFMKGIFQIRPPLPRYNKTWDVSLVLQYFESMEDTEELTLKDLTLKFVMLVAQRGQSLHLMDIGGMVKEQELNVFMLNDNVKQSKPTKSQSELIIKLKAYPQDKKLCVVHTCSIYLDKTSSVRGEETKLFLTYQKPHKNASRDTIRRWIHQVMMNAGVDVNVYKPHSVRAAATSKAKANKASLLEIMNTAGWSSAATFAKFYDKHIETEQTFSHSVLSINV